MLRRLTTFDAVDAVSTRLASSRRPGIGKLRTLLDDRRDGFAPSESELEALLFAAVADPRIPPVRRQMPFPWSPAGSHRVDGFIEEWGLLLEADGRRWHARLATMESDRRRDQEAVRRGYRTLRFGWTDLRDDASRVRDVVISAGATYRPPSRESGHTRTKARPTIVLSGTGPM